MILVTGGAGFIGSNFVLDWVASCDEPLVNLDALTYAGNLENLRTLDGHPGRECQKSCVRAGCIDQSLKTNRSPNWIASWALAACHAIGGRFQFSVMCRSASQISFVAA